MKIELKNIRISELASEETTFFKADLFLDGKKVGYANNDGQGGCTNYNRYPNIDYSVIQSMEDYCKTLPPIVYTKEEHGMAFTIDMNLEHYIDNIIFDSQNKKAEKKLAKDFNKGVCYGKTFHYTIQCFEKDKKSITIEELLKDDKGGQSILNTCARLIREGKTILNTNLPFYDKNGLSMGYYTKTK